MKPELQVIIAGPNPDENQLLVKRLCLIGFHKIIGYLNTPFESLDPSSLSSLAKISVEDLKSKLGKKDIVIDVRKPDEWAEGHLAEAKLITLANFPSESENFEESLGPKENPIFTHCRAGGRSLIAVSYLLSKGFTNVTSIDGGSTAMIEGGMDFSAK